MRRPCTFLLTAALLSPTAAIAHSGTTQGTTTLTLGWATEPAFVGHPNRVEVLAVHDGEPRKDAKLTVEVLFGAADAERRTDPLRLEPVADRPGWYEAAIIPTAAGIYTFRVLGQVSEDRVDLTLTSGPDTFDSVIEPTELQFPEALPGAAEIADGAERAVSDAAAAAAAAKAADDAAATARLLALVALALAVLSFLLGGIAFRRRSS